MLIENDNILYFTCKDNVEINDNIINAVSEYMQTAKHSNFSFMLEFCLLNAKNNYIDAIKQLILDIKYDIIKCGICGEFILRDESYYQVGSDDGYYDFIFNNDLEYRNDINLTDDLASYVYDNISSLYDDIYYCSDCENDLYYTVNDLILEYKEYSNINYVNDYHSTVYSNKAVTDLTLGFEIEHEFTSLPLFEDIKRFLSRFGGFLNPEHDASLNNPAIEWVTDILDFEWLFNNKDFVKDFYSTIQSLLDCSSNCGGHLHCSLKFAGYTNPERVKTITNLIDFINDNTLLIKSISGRSNTFEYCELPQSYNIYDDRVSTAKYSAINIKYDTQTIEFRFWNTYKNYDSMIRRAVISYYMLFLAKNDLLTVDNLYSTLKLYSLSSEIDFKWYLDKIKSFL